MPDSGFVQRLKDRLGESAGSLSAIVAAGVLIALVVVIIHAASKSSRGKDILAEGQLTVIVCTACWHTGTERLALNQKFPVACPKCQENQAVLGQKCNDCETIFIRPNTASYACPHPQCRRRYVTSESGDF